MGVRIGDFVLDLAPVAEIGDRRASSPGLALSSLNAFMAMGPEQWAIAREWIDEVLRHDVHEERTATAPAPARRGRAAPPDRGRRLRRLLRLRAARLQRRPDLPARPGAAASQLEAPARRLPRSRGHGRRQRHRRSSDRAGSGSHRRRTRRPSAPVAAARHRGRARLRRRRPDGARRAGRHRRLRGPHLRRRRAQRLVGARHPGLGVRPARAVPRQVASPRRSATGSPRSPPSTRRGPTCPVRTRRSSTTSRVDGPAGLDIDVEVVLNGERGLASAVRLDVLVARADARPHHRQRRERAHRRPVGIGHDLRLGARPARVVPRAVVGRQGAVPPRRRGADVPRGRRRGDAALHRTRHVRRSHRAG